MNTEEKYYDYSEEIIDEANIYYEKGTSTNLSKSNLRSVASNMEERNRASKPCKFIRDKFSMREDHFEIVPNSKPKLLFVKKKLLEKAISNATSFLQNLNPQDASFEIQNSFNPNEDETVENKMFRYSVHSNYRSEKALMNDSKVQGGPRKVNLIEPLNFDDIPQKSLDGLWKEEIFSCSKEDEPKRRDQSSKKLTIPELEGITFNSNLDPSGKSYMMNTPNSRNSSIRRGFFLKNHQLGDLNCSNQISTEKPSLKNSLHLGTSKRMINLRKKVKDDIRKRSVPKITPGKLVRVRNGSMSVQSKLHMKEWEPCLVSEEEIQLKMNYYFQELLKGVFARSSDYLLRQFMNIQIYDESSHITASNPAFSKKSFTVQIVNKKTALGLDLLGLVSVIFVDDLNPEETRIVTILMQRGGNIDKKDLLGNTPFQNSILNVASS